ncbi:chlorite dismutase family protein [Microbacterium sp. ET2]|uniref:hydrogen peroxide-dependent heme synthase n=1 Tax=Microbacterium albipurpureum TaxID=3050384 RepID=UPI00259D048F|nr:hydrogen peroxide-dependent heme synthase [Microbacterium sp. ET2 (Ac-2212)]WJL96049.1 chlorite dismutase family protein [Microbacterium sp. ET2 (Ac-2212)]
MTDTAPSASSETPNDRHYALWAVLRREPGTPVPEELPAIVDVAAAAGDTLRGVYDVSGLRADADILLWLVGRSAEHLQAVLRDLRRTRELAGLAPTWNALGVHRDAEFSRDHSPAFARGLAPKQWVTVYPFVRSYEWYLLPAEERGAMLGEHGRMGRDYPQVQSNTVASFALGDYEWLLALEADDVIDLVDLMRYLRATEARRHVREEVPFFTGRLIEPSEIADVVR